MTMPFILETDNLVFFDVDETLILWVDPKTPGAQFVNDPYMPGELVFFVPHISHINLLKRTYHQDSAIVVWSYGGVRWATTIVEKLGLTDFVSLILRKPQIYVDDKPMEKWFPKRIYLEDNHEGNLK